MLPLLHPTEVSLKLDLCGLKLKFSQRQILSQEKRCVLAYLPYESSDQPMHYRETVKQIVSKISGTSVPVPPLGPNLHWENKR